MAKNMTWLALQHALREKSEEECWELLKKEKSGKRRLQYMLRIYGRANRLRAARERRDLVS